jgi:uncharacterized protein with NRDE domain
MCLLIAIHDAHPDTSLVVAANRDEWLARPASPFGVLRDRDPRTLGGRDELASGTWLATNEHGVIAGLTNKPVATGRDDSKRSRGELPLLLTRHASAAAAIESIRELDPSAFNPCWLLVGDRESLFYIDMTAGPSPRTERLPAGVHILENRGLHDPSAKADQVRRTLAEVGSWRGPKLVDNLGRVLASHEIPESARTGERENSWKPLETEAACVHAGPYGTRSATIALVGATDRPVVHHAEGAPCTARFTDVGHWWNETL